MKGRAIHYSEAELLWIRGHRDWPRKQMHAAFVERFGRSDVSQSNLTGLCKRMGWLTGRNGQFEKGQEPPNKGRKGFCPPGSEKGWFRKGQKPHTWRGAGHERIDSKDGYVVMILEETNPWSGGPTRPVLKHRYLWEQANGPVPEGHCLKCLDGDKTNTDPANWVAVPRALMPRLAGRWTTAYDAAPDELKPAILNTARLAHAAREARRRKA